MDESALRSLLKSLEVSWSSLDAWLNFWTSLVVVGLAIDVFVIIKEYLDNLRDFRRGTIHPPEKPGVHLLVLGLLGTGLITTGVAGELFVHVKAGKIEADMRTASDQLVVLVSKQAGNAKISAQGAADASSRAQKSANEAGIAAGKAQSVAGAVAVKAEELDRRLVATKAQLEVVRTKRDELEASLINLAVCNAPRVIPLWSIGRAKNAVDPLRPFAGRQAVIEFVPEPEAKRAANNIVLALISAGWKIVKISPEDNIEDGVEVQPRFVVPLHDASQEQLMQDWANTTRASQAADALVDFLHSYNWQARFGVPPRAERADIPLDGLKVRVGLYPAVVYVAPPGAKDFTEAIARNEQERERINKEVESEILKRNEAFLKRLPPKEAEKAAIELRVLREQRKKEEKLRRERDSGPCRPLSSLLPSLQ